MDQGQNPFNTPPYGAGGQYDIVAQHVLGIEGRLSDNASDYGGLTKFGCSLPFLQGQARIDPLVAQRFDLNGDGVIDAAYIQALTSQQVLNLFFHCIWCRKLRLDLAINDGSGAAIELLQTALNNFLVGVNYACAA